MLNLFQHPPRIMRSARFCLKTCDPARPNVAALAARWMLKRVEHDEVFGGYRSIAESVQREVRYILREG